jgi:T4-like virus tail tube protein gp19
MQQPYLLELNGKLAGRFFDFTGGGVEADVIVEQGGGGLTRKKHLGAVRYQEMVLACGTGMSHAFYDWVSSAFGGSVMRMTGAVIMLDGKSKPAARREFTDAIGSSVELPKLDRAAKKDAYMTVKVVPERTSYKSSSVAQDLGVYTSALPKAWNISAFRSQIDGLNTECFHVTRVSPLSLGRKIAQDVVGDSRDSVSVPGAIEFSNIALELPGAFADGFYKWADDSIVKGNTSEKNGSVDLFAPGSTSPHFSVKLSGLGIYKMEGRTKSTFSVTTSLYCEQMSFSAGAAAIK